MDTAINNLFEPLYFLESEELYVIEIKRNDLNEYAAIADKFQWLLISKSTLAITRLHFRSMDSSEEVEERFFEEGFLKFNTTNGTYIEKYNSAQHTLINNGKSPLATAVNNCISELIYNDDVNA